jgi:acetylornithine/succinyldiaminopimelate/putrescine aminotransferase
MPLHLNALFFCNSGAEAIEGAIKFARAATARPGLISLEGAFHGLSMGALSIMGNPHFQDGFGPYLDACHRVKIGDLATVETLLAKGDIAAVIIENLARKHGALLVSDEIQTGLGRTGKWFGFQHWDLEPDIITLAKSLSGGYVPVGAIATRRDIYQKTFSHLDRCVVHSSTFGRNNLAMAAGLATLQVIEDESLVENAARMGDLLISRLQALKQKHSVIKEVRGRGLILAVEFHEPSEITLKLGWKFLHKMEVNLFTQMVVTALLSRHRILTQVAAHGLDTLKILPPLMITEVEVDKFILALDSVLRDCRKFPGPLWDLGANFIRHSLRKPAPVS